MSVLGVPAATVGHGLGPFMPRTDREESRQPTPGESRAFLLFIAAQLNLHLPDAIEITVTVAGQRIYLMFHVDDPAARIPAAEAFIATHGEKWVSRRLSGFTDVHTWEGWYQGAAVEVSVVTPLDGEVPS